MSDKEIINNLNKESKKFIDDMYSFMDFLLIKNDIELKISYAAFLSALKNDKLLIKYFSNYNVTYENVYNKLFGDFNVVFNDVNKTKSISEISLSRLFKEIIIKTKFVSYLDDKNISIDQIQPYQIFDSLTIDNRYDLFSLIYDICDSNEIKRYESIMDDLDIYLYNFYQEFALLFDVNIKEEKKKELDSLNENNQLETSSSIIYEYDECKIIINDNNYYLQFSENANLNKLIYHINKLNDSSNRKNVFIREINLPQTYEIISINHDTDINENLIKSFLNNNEITKIPFELKNLKTGITDIVWLNKNIAFNSKNDYSDDVKPTPYIDKYGFDLTKDTYIKDPSIRRENEIRRIEQILLYPERDKSIIITGNAGCGKTALVKGLAYRIQKGLVPNALKNTRIINIDSATLVAGTKYVGTLEEKMKNILDEASESKDLIIFMDEIHQALGAGKSENDATSVSEILKPYLDYGRVRLIGATTNNEYYNFLNQDEAFKTRFKRIDISEPDYITLYEIIEDLINSYNKLSDKNEYLCPKLNLSLEEKDFVIKTLIEATKEKNRRFDDKSNNPRLVLDIVKEAYAIATINDRFFVTIDDIKEAILLEDRLYPGSKKDSINKLDTFIPNNNDNKIIQFVPRLKK